MKTFPLSSQPETSAPRFGRSAAPVSLRGGDKLIYNTLGELQKNRTQEMLAEDLICFGLLRAGIDMGREFLYDKKNLQQAANDNRRQPQLNLPAARERIMREIGSILTDNVSGGVFAFGIAAAANKLMSPANRNFANAFTSMETLEQFSTLAKQSGDAKAFVGRIAASLSGDAAVRERIVRELNLAIEQDTKLRGEMARVSLPGKVKAFFRLQPSPVKNLYNDTAVNIAQILKQQHVNTGTLGPLPDLVEDTARFVNFMGKDQTNWQSRAVNALQQTIKLNKVRLPVSIGLAMGLTMAVPYLTQWVTRKVDGIDSYPATLGLKPAKKADPNARTNMPWYERYFPYLTESLRKNNPVPLLLTLFPLVFGLGIFDISKLSKTLSLKQSFNNPLYFKTFLKNWGRMMQFGKGFPFTTMPQMAACFAFLITSRLASSREVVEFRERVVDCFMGWGLWIMGTPLLKRTIAGILDRRNGFAGPAFKLLDGGALRNRLEIERLLPEGVKAPLLKQYLRLSAGSLFLNMLLTGILEPLLALKWTEYQTTKEHGKKEKIKLENLRQVPVRSGYKPAAANDNRWDSGWAASQPAFRRAM